ncbi:Aste57867_18668 [Aphanomyces stellatus]|uniref:Aste57867_18668 protein n=1 Tax=Aphanomyces stellatus TaxID=120398 RepID=A0A485LBB2_9STRA|nr:hypothetical protein As57867_018606 [Aphanomyces stellatus]VFT95403.1 Aste57867_18668 [Aphanomyces stellatus]
MSDNPADATMTLLEASKAGTVDHVRHTLQQGNVDVNAMGSLAVEEIGMEKDGTALMWASRYNRVAVVELLLRQPSIQVNRTNDARVSALYLACQNGNSDVVYALLACPDIDINQEAETGYSALYIASRNGHVEVVDALLTSPTIDVNFVNKAGKTALNVASELGYIGVVEALLKSPVIDANLVDDEGLTALLLASLNNHIEVVLALLASPNVDIDVVDEMGASALTIATDNSAIEIVDALLASPSINVNHVVESGASALYIACENGAIEIVNSLLACPSLDVNLVDEDGISALSIACESGHSEVVNALLAHPDIDINLRNKDNWSALFSASQFGHVDVVNALLANPAIEINYADKMLEMAKRQKHFDIVALLSYKSAGIESIHNTSGKLVLESLANTLCHELATNLLLLDLPVEIKEGNLVRRQEHSFSWTTFLDAKLPVASAVRQTCIDAILNHDEFKSHSQHLCHELAFTKDQYGRDVLEITDAATRKFFNDRLFFCGRYELFEGPPVHVSSTSVVAFAYDHDIFNHVFDEYADCKTGEMRQEGFVKCNQALGRWSTERNSADKQNARDVDLWRREFRTWDKDNSDQMCKDEFFRYCAQHFGRKFKVALKFMRNEDEYQRETHIRKRLSSNLVLHLLPTVDIPTFQQHVLLMEPINGDIKMTEYQYLLAMPAADRSLEDIFLKERPSDTKTRSYLHDIALSLNRVHKNGLVHGDMKKLNILRVHNQLKLIDFDATTTVGDKLGVKFSSGVLPPEMFYQLQDIEETKQYEEYWGSQTQKDPKRWYKLKPRNNFVVRSYRHGHTKNLPYTLVEATPAVDMWSFGCLMYQMLCGVELISTDINQDIVSDKVKDAATWTDELLHRRIENNIADESAQHLIKQLLVVNPTSRLSMQEVLNHPYFTGVFDLTEITSKLNEIGEINNSTQIQVQELTESISASQRLQAKLSGEMNAELKCTMDDMTHGILEANEVRVPTTFVLLPFKLNHSELGNPWSQEFKQFVALGKNISRQIPHDNTNLLEWIAAVRQVIQPLVDELKRGKSMYLYLIDEVTSEIVTSTDSVYPIEIPTTDDVFWRNGYPWIGKGLAMLTKAAKTIESCNENVENLDDFLWPDASITQEETQNVNSDDDDEDKADTTANLAQENNETPIYIQGTGSTIRGAELRQLAHWFTKHDPDHSFCGLKRIVNDKGNIVWTTLRSMDSPAKVELNRESVFGLP